MIIEILSFEGCPNAASARSTVERLLAELDLDPEIRLIDVPNPEAAERMGFLGSPTIRVDGRDVEPGSEERSDFVLGCRVYRTGGGFAGLPPERWIRESLTEAARRRDAPQG